MPIHQVSTLFISNFHYFYPKQPWAEMGKVDAGRYKNYPKVLWAEMGNGKDGVGWGKGFELGLSANQEKFYPKLFTQFNFEGPFNRGFERKWVKGKW